VKRYYTDDTVTLWLGDALDVLRTLPDESAESARRLWPHRPNATLPLERTQG
jgi:hypothetical protein